MIAPLPQTYLFRTPLVTPKTNQYISMLPRSLLFEQFSIAKALQLHAGFIANLRYCQLRINQIMSSRAAGWNYIEIDHF